MAIASALAIRGFLFGADYSGVTLVQLGIVSLKLEYVINTGVNFGIASAGTYPRQILLATLAILVCAFILIWGFRSNSGWSISVAGLFAGGGLANAFERIAYSGVFDYLNVSASFYENPFSFNLADIYILLGLVAYIFRPTREA